MARLARVVAPGVPHPVTTRRGNRRQRTFFSDDDDRLYRMLMGEWCARSGVEIWAYRLMGDDAFVDRFEASLGRTLRPRKPGPKPRKDSKEPRDQ